MPRRLRYWAKRIETYEQGFKGHLEWMRANHQAAQDKLMLELEKRRPTQPKSSSEYLNLRKQEGKLITAKHYDTAQKLKKNADLLYQAELDQTLAEYDATAQLKLARLQAKQQQEVEVLVQRASMGRDEFERKKQQQLERRYNRLRTVIAELESLHKLEVVQMENFLDAQVMAGKALPLPDAFQRKRDAIFGQFARY